MALPDGQGQVNHPAGSRQRPRGPVSLKNRTFPSRSALSYMHWACRGAAPSHFSPSCHHHDCQPSNDLANLSGSKIFISNDLSLPVRVVRSAASCARLLYKNEALSQVGTRLFGQLAFVSD